MTTIFKITGILLAIIYLECLTSCSKLRLSNPSYTQYDWRYTVVGPGLDTIWPDNNDLNIQNAKILREQTDYDNIFHFYINDELIGVKHFDAVLDDQTGASALWPSTYSKFYRLGETGNNFLRLKTWSNYFTPISNEPLICILDFPINLNSEDTLDTIYYPIYELKIVTTY